MSWLSWFYRGIITLIFLVLLTRLVELQVIKGAYYRNLSEENRIRRVSIVAPRGKILARGGEELVGSLPSRRKIVFDDSLGAIKVDLDDPREGYEIMEWKRSWRLGEDFAHASGYLGQVTEEEVGKVNPGCPEKGVMREGQLTGRSGLEQEYECLLSGVDGEELIEIDSTGKKIRVLGKVDPIAGKNLKTNIDFGLQTTVAKVISQANSVHKLNIEKGAVVASDSKGEILALYSFPSFDPDLISRGEGGAILSDKKLPLLDRAIGGVYHPGSVFKPCVAVGALSDGVIDDDYLYSDPGVIKVNSYSYSNWYFTQYGGLEGNINLQRALARSTDTFFYKLGEMMGIDNLVTWAKEFGYGVQSGIDIPSELGGLVPSPKWKEEVKDEKWFLGNTYHFAIGQGDLLVTPIQVNRATDILASRGLLCNPRLVGTPICQNLKVKKSDIGIVIAGMKDACSPGGTGYTFFDFPSEVACKTGTAEIGIDTTTHAWFSVFTPIESPELVLTVLVEKGGEGSKVAGPLARDILDYWVGREKYR